MKPNPTKNIWDRVSNPVIQITSVDIGQYYYGLPPAFLGSERRYAASRDHDTGPSRATALDDLSEKHSNKDVKILMLKNQVTTRQISAHKVINKVAMAQG